MKSSNQGFVDLHTPSGFFLVGACFLILTLVIVAGGIFAKNIAAKEKLARAKMKDDRDSSNKPDA